MCVYVTVRVCVLALLTSVLPQIIYRTTLEHPHHCLYVILALSNATKDNRYPTSGHVSGTRVTKATGRLARKTSNVGTVDEVHYSRQTQPRTWDGRGLWEGPG